MTDSYQFHIFDSNKSTIFLITQNIVSFFLNLIYFIYNYDKKHAVHIENIIDDI